MQSTDYDARSEFADGQYANPDRLIKPRPIPPLLDTQAHPASDHRGIRVADAVGFYAGYAAEALRQPGARRIISFGAGDCVHEIALIKRLLEMGKGLRRRRDGICHPTWRNRRTGEAKLKINEMGSRYLFICLYSLAGEIFELWSLHEPKHPRRAPTSAGC